MTEVVQASAAEARDLTDRIKVAVDGTWHLIKQAYQSFAWKALGYSSWDDYCTREFGTSRLKLPREERQEVVSSMREIGMSTRAIAAATGVSHTTVRESLTGGRNLPPEPAAKTRWDELAESWNDSEPTALAYTPDFAEYDEDEQEEPEEPVAPAPRVKGTDGKSYPAVDKTRQRQPRTDVVATVNKALLRAQDSAREAQKISRQHLAGRNEEAASWSRSLSVSLEALNHLQGLLMEASA